MFFVYYYAMHILSLVVLRCCECFRGKRKATFEYLLGVVHKIIHLALCGAFFFFFFCCLSEGITKFGIRWYHRSLKESFLSIVTMTTLWIIWIYHLFFSRYKRTVYIILPYFCYDKGTLLFVFGAPRSILGLCSLFPFSSLFCLLGLLGFLMCSSFSASILCTFCIFYVNEI